MRTLMQEDIKIFASGAKLQATFTAATTDIITSTAHGLSVGDIIQVASATTLPAGLSASTDYYVISVPTANTFKVSATQGGTTVDITDTGTGTHTFYLKGKKILVSDASSVILSLNTSNSGAFKLQFQGSTQDDVDFNAAASVSNRWDYLQSIDLNSGTKYSGDDGYTLSGVDQQLLFEININGMRWITVLVSSWSAGNLDAKASLYGN